MFIIIGCALAFPLTLALSTRTSGTAQEEDKVVEKRDDFNPPVKIKLVKSRIGTIETDKKIDTADNEWLRRLTIRVRNLSDKTVTHVLVRLQFIRPKDQAQERDLIIPLEYGPSPLRSSQQDVPAEPILPGKTADITLSDSEYDSLLPLLYELNYPVTIKRVRVFIGAIGFSDSTIWQGGRIFKRDANDPQKWIPLDKSQSKGQAGARADPFLFIKDFNTAHGIRMQFDTCGVASSYSYKRCGDAGTPDCT